MKRFIRLASTLLLAGLAGCSSEPTPPPVIPESVANQSDVSAERLDQMTRGLESKKSADRLRSVKALHSVGKAAERFVPRLEQLSQQDPDPAVRTAAAAAVKELRGD